MIIDTMTMPARIRRADGLAIRYADTGAANGPGILLSSRGQKASSRSAHPADRQPETAAIRSPGPPSQDHERFS